MAPSFATTNKKRIYSASLPTPPGKLLFAWLAEPDTVGQYADNKYKATIRLPKSEAADQFIAALQAFAAKHLPCGPNEYLVPVKDGALRTSPDPEHWYVTAKSKLQPKTVDAALKPLDPTLIRTGATVRLAVLASPYTMQQTVVERGRQVRRDMHGITLYLQAVQLIAPAPEVDDAPRDPLESLGTFHDAPVPF